MVLCLLVNRGAGLTMSHANGLVIRGTEIIGFFEYNGTVNMVMTAIRDTYKELQEKWRNDNMAECICGEPPEEVVLYTDYGRSFHFPAKICLRCRAILSDPTDEERFEKEKTGLPEGVDKNWFTRLAD